MSTWFRRFRSRPGTWGRAHLLKALELESSFSSMHNVFVAACGVRVGRSSLHSDFESGEVPADACARCAPGSAA